jgi:group I intron endonuclease
MEMWIKLSLVHKRIERSEMFGKIHSLKIKELMSLARSGENHPLWSKIHNESTKLAMNIAKGIVIYVYIFDKSTLVNTFVFARKAGEFFSVNKNTILRYTKNGKLFQDKWILSTDIYSLDSFLGTASKQDSNI